MAQAITLSERRRYPPCFPRWVRISLLLISSVALVGLRAAQVDTQSPGPASTIAPPHNIRIFSRQLRVDISWSGDSTSQFEIQRAPSSDGPFENIHIDFPDRTIQSDFLGQGGNTFYYRVRSIHSGADQSKSISEWSPIVRGSPTKADPETLLTEVQEAGFRYFYDYGHPVSGLARESFRRNPEMCAIGATGMGMFNLVVAVERKFIDRDDAVARALQELSFLTHKAVRFHGAFPHWINGTTGEVIPFSKEDDGADLVETAFLMQGVILLREYFSQDTEKEKMIRSLADDLWREVEWSWFMLNEGVSPYLAWHWSPKYRWKKNMRITGFNEAQCAYLLAMASPTFSICPQCYRSGWETTGFGKLPAEGKLSSDENPSLFFTHYSYLGFDPKQFSFSKKTYFEHFQNYCKAQVNYAARNSKSFAGYGPLWGITASYGPDGYDAFAPGQKDNGTLAPTAALSSMPYVPEESRMCLREMYEKHGKKLWGPFGFYDAFNMKRDWVSNDVLGIDVGPIAPMIENYRTGLCWRVFMQAPEIRSVIQMLAEGKN